MMNLFDQIYFSEKYNLVTSVIISQKSLGAGVRRSVSLLNPFPWLYIIDVVWTEQHFEKIYIRLVQFIQVCFE